MALIASGETSGGLARAAEAAAALVERRAAGRGALLSALAYPAFVLVAALLALGVFVGFAQPRFEEVLRATGAEVSAATAGVLRRLARASRMGRAAPRRARGVRRRRAGRLGDRRREEVGGGRDAPGPLVGPLIRDRALEAYAGALGAMLEGGAPLPDAARLAARTLGAPRLEAAGAEAARMVAEGRPFSEALASSAAFPESLAAFAEIGEETGGLAPLMTGAARHFGQEAEARARRLSAVAAPAATLFLGL